MPRPKRFALALLAAGTFTGGDGHVAFCGAGGVTGDGDGTVGEAIIPAEVLDASDLATLEGAAGADACAAVYTSGVVMMEQEGGLDIDTEVVVSLVLPSASPALDDGPAGAIPTMSPTSTFGATRMRSAAARRPDPIRGQRTGRANQKALG